MNKTSYPRDLLFGRWYRNEQDEQGNETVEYAQLSADGSFEFTFTTKNSQGEIVDEITELGDWGLVGDIHFTITKDELIAEELFAADLNNADNYHAYKVLTLNHHIFHYQHRLTNEEYIMRRVVDNLGHC
ncbi:hypothetical protein [Colwellia sp. E2M01]|uniref:hypothetical protein n=1 Tax=Colwellia sp. E2M01 TaxID=2841561 RepID=UPI0020910CC8|nr:hypothetical protein [Colwellia sp. E2M01]